MRSKFELFVQDPSRSARFYRSLGFEERQRKDNGYRTLSRGSTVVALSPVSAPFPLRWLGRLRRPPWGTELVFYVTDLEAERGRLEQAGYRPGPIAMRPWGLKDFRISDPDGYYLRLTEGEPWPRTPEATDGAESRETGEPTDS